MKYAIYLLVLFVFMSCRSSKHRDTDYTVDTAMERNENSQQSDSTVTVIVVQDTTRTETTIEEFERTTTYQPDGTILSISERWRSTGSTQVHTSNYNETTKSGSHRTDSLKMAAIGSYRLKEIVKTESDSRLIQGSEWLYILPGLLVVFGILRAIYFYKKQKT